MSQTVRMADDPRVPKDVIDAVMADPTFHRLAYLMSGRDHPVPLGVMRDLRTDISGLIGVALEAFVNVPVRTRHP